MNTKEELVKIMEDFTDLLMELFNSDRKTSFLAASYILSVNTLPAFTNIEEEGNKKIKKFYDSFKSMSYTPQDMRMAFNEAYLYSLKDVKDFEIETTLELPLLYLRLLTLAVTDNLNYDHVIVFNPSSNSGSLAASLSLSGKIKDEDLYVLEDRSDYSRLTLTLRDLCERKYKVSDALPSLSFKADVIVSDPFLRSVEDILIFFEDYHEYLNNDGFFIVSLMTDFVRSRVFTDMIEKYGYKFIGLIEYPKDLMEGLIQNSIVILENKKEENKEFFHAEMPSIKNVDANIKVMNEIKDYLVHYIRSENNENNVN